ncbi:hypothetical protein ACQ4PT_054456 [Festuca glaucescens]
MKRQFVNLVTRSWAGWIQSAESVYSVRRLNPHHHFFYGSAEAALQAADDAAKKNEPFPATQTLQQLPTPVMNFAAIPFGKSLDMFALLGHGRMVYANPIGEAGMYDADRHLQYAHLPRLNSPKGFKPMCLSIAADGEDSMYVLNRYPGKGSGRCFEVLEPIQPPELRRKMRHSVPPWRWRLLPPPPFVRDPEYGPSSVTSFAAVADGDGRSTIYISCPVGTYSFDTACSDSDGHGLAGSEGWSHVGEWRLPFRDRAHYVPEFSMWFGFLDSSPNHLCAVDLSSAAMDRRRGRPPAVQQVWQDLADPPEGEGWLPSELELVYLGDGRFLVAKTFEAEATSQRFTLLTGVEMMPDVGGQSLQMVKHKCARFVFRSDTIEWVL